MAEQLTLDLDGWEGPLDLLLSLARNQKVDLRQISILALVEQYLGFVEGQRRMELELAADYLVMAAWLAYLKSAMLLPRRGDEDADDPDAMAARLQHRLERLSAMREAGARLMARPRLGREVFMAGRPEGLTDDTHAIWTVDLNMLIAAHARTLARTRPVLHVVAERDVMPLDAAIARVAALIGEAIDWRAIERFLPEVPREAYRRSALASSFVAALELARQGRVELRQAAAFAPLYLRAPA